MVLGVGRVKEAEVAFRRAVQLRPEDSEALAKHALSLAKLHPPRMEEALATYDRAVEAPRPAGQNDRSRAMLLAQRAMALSALARTSEAKSVAREALVLCVSSSAVYICLLSSIHCWLLQQAAVLLKMGPTYLSFTKLAELMHVFLEWNWQLDCRDPTQPLAAKIASS